MTLWLKIELPWETENQNKIKSEELELDIPQPQDEEHRRRVQRDMPEADKLQVQAVPRSSGEALKRKE